MEIHGGEGRAPLEQKLRHPRPSTSVLLRDILLLLGIAQIAPLSFQNNLLDKEDLS